MYSYLYDSTSVILGNTNVNLSLASVQSIDHRNTQKNIAK